MSQASRIIEPMPALQKIYDAALREHAEPTRTHSIKTRIRYQDPDRKIIVIEVRMFKNTDHTNEHTLCYRWFVVATPFGSVVTKHYGDNEVHSDEVRNNRFKKITYLDNGFLMISLVNERGSWVPPVLFEIEPGVAPRKMYEE
jgi:hypothetical protein